MHGMVDFFLLGSPAAREVRGTSSAATLVLHASEPTLPPVAVDSSVTRRGLEDLRQTIAQRLATRQQDGSFAPRRAHQTNEWPDAATCSRSSWRPRRSRPRRLSHCARVRGEGPLRQNGYGPSLPNYTRPIGSPRLIRTVNETPWRAPRRRRRRGNRMFLTDHFVFLHVPRTGGNFVRLLLEQHAPSVWHATAHTMHATIYDIPASHARLPRLAFVRNPYAWYVSWYCFQQRTRDAFFLQITDGGTLSFAETMRRLLEQHGSFARGEGPFTQTLREMLGPDVSTVRVGRFERLRGELLRLWAGCVPVPPPLVAAVHALPAQNVSEHRHWSTYYDDDLRALVAEKDRDALRCFGYGFEAADA